MGRRARPARCRKARAQELSYRQSFAFWPAPLRSERQIMIKSWSDERFDVIITSLDIAILRCDHVGSSLLGGCLCAENPVGDEQLRRGVLSRPQREQSAVDSTTGGVVKKEM